MRPTAARLAAKLLVDRLDVQSAPRTHPEPLQVMHAQNKELMEKPAAELSVADMKVMQRSAERMLAEIERDIKDPEEPLASMVMQKHPQDMRKDKIKEDLEEMGVVSVGGPGPAASSSAGPFDLSESELEALRAKILEQRATASSSSSGPAGPQSPT